MGDKRGERSLIRDAEFEPLNSIESERKNVFDTGAKPRHAIDLPHSTKTRKGLARVVTVMNLKGGVGKTTSVINIGARCANLGLRVLIIDLDSQGNCATGLGIDKSKADYTTKTLFLNPEKATECRYSTGVENLHIIVADGRLISLEQEIMADLGREHYLSDAIESLLPFYDLVLIDTPPNLNLLSINALTASDGVIIPVQTEYFALEGLAMLTNSIKEVRKRINPRLGVDGIFLTMHAPTILNNQVAGLLREHFWEHLVEPPVRRNIKLAEATSHGQPITVFAPNSNGGNDYSALAENLVSRWALVSGGN